MRQRFQQREKKPVILSYDQNQVKNNYFNTKSTVLSELEEKSFQSVKSKQSHRSTKTLMFASPKGSFSSFQRFKLGSFTNREKSAFKTLFLFY